MRVPSQVASPRLTIREGDLGRVGHPHRGVHVEHALLEVEAAATLRVEQGGAGRQVERDPLSSFQPTIEAQQVDLLVEDARARHLELDREMRRWRATRGHDPPLGAPEELLVRVGRRQAEEAQAVAQVVQVDARHQARAFVGRQALQHD